MKRKLKRILSILCAAVLVFGLAPTAFAGHTTHQWSAAWQTSETHHWHNCELAGCDLFDREKDGYALHSWMGYRADDEYHWMECYVCGKVGEKTAHVYNQDWTGTQNCMNPGNVGSKVCVCGKFVTERNLNGYFISPSTSNADAASAKDYEDGILKASDHNLTPVKVVGVLYCNEPGCEYSVEWDTIKDTFDRGDNAEKEREIKRHQENAHGYKSPRSNVSLIVSHSTEYSQPMFIPFAHIDGVRYEPMGYGRVVHWVRPGRESRWKPQGQSWLSAPISLRMSILYTLSGVSHELSFELSPIPDFATYNFMEKLIGGVIMSTAFGSHR